MKLFAFVLSQSQVIMCTEFLTRDKTPDICLHPVGINSWGKPSVLEKRTARATCYSREVMLFEKSLFFFFLLCHPLPQPGTP